jgi:probable HAF family extracellular repeat protein
MKRLILTAAIVLMVPPARGEAGTFQGLGDLPGGDFYSEANAVSADGATVVGTSGSANSYHEAFRWTQTAGLQGLGSLPGTAFDSDAYAVSSDGSVVVGYSASGLSGEAFRWTQAGGMVGLGDLPPPPHYIDFPSQAMGVSADGLLVVGTANYSRGGGPVAVTGEAFRWTQSGAMVGLGDVPGGNGVSRAFGVSADGLVIVGKGNAGSSFQVEDLGVACRWTQSGGMVPLGFLPGGGYSSAATAVSAEGSVVVGYSDSASGSEAFRWTAATKMVGLGYLNPAPHGNQSHANAVSADGSVVVGSSAGTAFVWTSAGGMRSVQSVLTDDFGIDLTGWTLQEATGVSADGNTLVGWGQNPSGGTEAWRAHIQPLEQLGLPDPPGGLGRLNRSFLFTGGSRSLSLDMAYSTGGRLTAELISPEDLSPAAQTALQNYMAVGLFPQMWDVSFEGEIPEATLVFHYDEAALKGIDESLLAIWRFAGGSWSMGGVVDEEANTVSLTVDGFSSFSLGVVPEPSTLALLGAGAVVLLACAWWKRLRPGPASGYPGGGKM